VCGNGHGLALSLYVAHRDTSCTVIIAGRKSFLLPGEEQTVAKYLVPEWRIVTPAYGFRTGLPAYVAWRAGTTILCWSQLYPPMVTMNLATGHRGDRLRNLQEFC
jgi:hypothetical protein